MGQKTGNQMLDENQEIKNLKSFFEIHYSSFEFLTMLGRSSIQKTVLVQEKQTGIKYICKLYPKSAIVDEDFQKYKNKFTDLKNNLAEIKGVVHIDKIEEKDNYGLVFREYLPFNYKDILIYFTSLSPSEKKLICLQLLLNLYNLHKQQVIHGDLKLANVLFTSKLSVFLSDVAVHKPVDFAYTDIGVYNTFFRNNNNIFEDFCYLSPNRVTIEGETRGKDQVLIEDDVFSLGVVIAEIFLGEEGLFTIDELLYFKTKNKAKFDLEKKLKKINDKNLENLLLTKMINLDAKKNTKDIILEFITKICPSPIPAFLAHFNYLICYENYFENDLIIALMWRHLKQIWRVLYKGDKFPKISHKPNPKTIENLYQLKTFYDLDVFKIPFNCVFKPENEEINEVLLKKYLEKNKNENDDCTVVIIRLILSTFINMKFESNLLTAIELLECFSDKISDKNILFDLIIPHLIYLFKIDGKFKIENGLVLISSLKLILKLLENIEPNEEIDLTFNGNSYFTYFISKKIFELFFASTLFVKSEIIESLDKIISLQKKFLKMELTNNKKEYEKKLSEKFTVLESSNIYNTVLMQESVFYFNKTDDAPKPEKSSIEKYLLLYKDQEAEFQNQIDAVIESVFINESEDEEVLKAILIRKFPSVLLFFGKKNKKYLVFLMMQFNRNNFLVQKEILKICPFLIIVYGNDFYKEYYSVFLEKIQRDKKNEVLVLEAIRSIFQICKLNLFGMEKILFLFKQFVKYLKHPNFQIRLEMKKLFFFLIKKCEIEKKNNVIFSFLFEDIQKIHNENFFVIDKNLVENLTNNFVDRNNFNLFKNYSYDFNERKNILNLLTKNK